MEQQLTHISTFVNKPFYKWWFNKCSECSKRSLWKSMAKCTGCKQYNHGTCILPEHNACNVDATKRDFTTAGNRNAQQSTLQEGCQCGGPTVTIRPGHYVELQMCRCPNVSLANVAGLNLLGPRQRTLWASDSDDELEADDQPRVVSKRRRLMGAKKMIMRFFTGGQPRRQNDQGFAESSLENVTTITRHGKFVEKTTEDSVEDMNDVVDLEHSVDLVVRPPPDNAIDQIRDFDDCASDTTTANVTDNPKPIINERTAKCIVAAAQQDDGQCGADAVVVDQQAPDSVTADRPKNSAMAQHIDEAAPEICWSNTGFLSSVWTKCMRLTDTRSVETYSDITDAKDLSVSVETKTQGRSEEVEKLKTSIECDAIDECLPSSLDINSNAIDPEKNPRQNDHVDEDAELKRSDVNGALNNEI